MPYIYNLLSEVFTVEQMPTSLAAHTNGAATNLQE